jgi:WD40 repeat protein
MNRDESHNEPLTAREQEILTLIADGCSYAEICMLLHIKETTVKFHVQQIYDKLGLEAGQRKHSDLIAHASLIGLLGTTTSYASPMTFVRNPYKGLLPFLQVDAQNFFGREALIQQLVLRLAESGAWSRFLAVVGPSGCGKSSVVHAGLLPALQRGMVDGSSEWIIVTLTPGPYPLEELEIALTRAASLPNINVRDQLLRDERGLQRVAGMVLADHEDMLLVVDQFEEIFSLVRDETQRRHFLALLARAATYPHSRVRVVITLRADCYDRPLLYSKFGELLRQRTEVVLPLTPEELEQAIRRPAQQVGVAIEPGLVAAIVADGSEQPGSLSLVQYSLTELFNYRTQQGMTLETYNQIGGLRGALTRRADALYEGLSEPQQALARQLFLRLVMLSNGSEDLRRKVPLAELTGVSVNNQMLNELISEFATYRLLTLDADPVVGGATVIVSHGALIHEWGRLRTWLDECRSDLRLQRILAANAREWRIAGQDKSYLLHGSRLAQFESWKQPAGVVLTKDEREYLDASIAESQRQGARRRLIRRSAFAIMAMFALVFAVLSLWANRERTHAEVAENVARRQASIGLAAQSRNELENGVQERAVLLALEALEHYPYTSPAESALGEAVAAYVPYTDIASKDGTNWLFFTWSPDGQRIALGGAQSLAVEEGGRPDIIEIVDAHDYTPLTDLSVGVLGCVPHGMAWSPDGERLASIYLRGEYASDQCRALPTVWDTRTGDLLYELIGHEGLVTAIDWSPDGSSILTSGADGTIRLWEAETGAEKLTNAIHTDSVNDAVWSPDGNQIASASTDGTVRVWNSDLGHEVLIFASLTGRITGVSWSPDGNRLAAASEDGLAHVWDVENGGLRLNLIGHDAGLVAVRYSPSGDRIATASTDGTARLWDAETGELLMTFPRLGNQLRGVSWSPDGNSLAVGGPRIGKIWDVSSKSLYLSGHTASIMDGKWSPDGTHIVTGSFDGTVRIWDAVNGKTLWIFDHPDRVFYLDWSPDGTRIVTACADGTARIWDISTGEMVRDVSMTLADDMLFEASWSPDGKLIMAGDLASHAVIWDSATGSVVTTLDFDAARVLLGPDETFCVLFGSSWSPDGIRLATGCTASTVGTGPLIWDALTGKLIMALADIGGQEDSTIRTDWSPDGSRLVTSHASGVIRMWDLQTGGLLRSFVGHTTFAYAVAWSPSGTRIVSGDRSGMVKVWDVASGAEVDSFQGPGNVPSAHWSPDERYIIAVGEFNTPIIRRVWPSTRSLIDYAYECCVTRELTPEERTQLGLLYNEK